MRALSPDDPRDIGPYRLRAVLGAGGMGRVYLGTGADGTLAAVKSVRAEFAYDSGFRARFARELALTGRAHGPFIPRVLDHDSAARLPWMATEYVAGPTLHDLVREAGPLPEESVRFLLRAVASVLEGMHGNGLVHRDLKPGNVMVAAVGPQVIDFGVSKALEGAENADDEETLTAGTPGYTAPEQYEGAAASPATDVFALAGTAVYALTGTGPFGEGHPSAVAYRITRLEPDLASVPEDLRGLLSRCLAKVPGDRPSAAGVLEELGGPVDPVEAAPDWLPVEAARRVEEAAQAHREYTSPHPRRPAALRRRRGPWAVGAGAAALILAAGAGVWAVSERGAGAAWPPWAGEGAQRAGTDGGTGPCSRPEDFAAEYAEAARERLEIPGEDGYDLDMASFPRLAFVAEGELLAVSHPTGVALWDWEAGKEVAFVGESLPDFAGLPTVSPDGCRFAYLSTEGGLHVFDLRSGERTMYFPDLVGLLAYEPVVFSPDGGEVTIGPGGTRRIDLETGAVTDIWEEAVGWAAYSPDGEHLALNQGSFAAVLETSTGREVFRREGVLGAEPGSVALPNDEGDLLYLSANPEAVVHINYLTETEPRLFSPEGEPPYLSEELVVAPGTDRFHLLHGANFITGSSGRRTTWDLSTGEEVTSGTDGAGEADNRTLAAHPAGEVLAVLPREATTVLVVDAATAEVLAELG
ncbi:serine/threonine-protein kinase [Nocardiopsis dassonvillei]|uniref:Serine/threonine protein kinase n=1 Tax=Nocardiopsis dassonvillei (strain ATCC 23218 / DSM 43111 / CIP 107115 / JCM 7437 / KCTC 9190 / NBRC 14626 / NCTC 10488 / NRRL B-5397 / IMRU 509) TaxID=446468 RepID=D7AYV1_NOCDD|nr:serine/threonine-protein kinase [Nocardiopsis dassonvillei]ADH68113.1 serine/threonine protein kinase [Nocardiopsis dassonvillei subsp. dassonvillei DSM 43111]NKY77242.1 protein kinase [Nocardiopsis dassonvillei]VEI88613.1 Serine/threonine-protein kinase AfsK [Nocardiopsis dassonvillei]